MFIAYDVKNGKEYGKACTSKREGSRVTKTYINLGRVLDKEKLIFQNRERGIFTFDPSNGTFGVPAADFNQPKSSQQRERLILDFGDAFFLDTYINNSGLKEAVKAIGYRNPDTLYSMLFFYILCAMSNQHAEEWWEGSYARILFPKAALSSQRISEFLADIGEERRLRDFFGKYIPYVSAKCENCDDILIDSTGLPNNIHFPLTAISNHNGDISNEVRLIYVTQQETGLPIYFRYCPGNVIDVSTLARTIAELKANGMNTKFAILDAGYYDDENVRTLYECKVSFLTRLRENRKIYKEMVSEYLPSIQNEENLVEYNGRYVYIQCVPCCLVDDYSAYAYICLDIGKRSITP